MTGGHPRHRARDNLPPYHRRCPHEQGSRHRRDYSTRRRSPTKQGRRLNRRHGNFPEAYIGRPPPHRRNRAVCSTRRPPTDRPPRPDRRRAPRRPAPDRSACCSTIHPRRSSLGPVFRPKVNQNPTAEAPSPPPPCIRPLRPLVPCSQPPRLRRPDKRPTAPPRRLTHRAGHNALPRRRQHHPAARRKHPTRRRKFRSTFWPMK